MPHQCGIQCWHLATPVHPTSRLCSSYCPQPNLSPLSTENNDCKPSKGSWGKSLLSLPIKADAFSFHWPRLSRHDSDEIYLQTQPSEIPEPPPRPCALPVHQFIFPIDSHCFLHSSLAKICLRFSITPCSSTAFRLQSFPSSSLPRKGYAMGSDSLIYVHGQYCHETWEACAYIAHILIP